MSNLTPKALERLEKKNLVIDFDGVRRGFVNDADGFFLKKDEAGPYIKTSVFDFLLASYRALQRENRIAMRALEIGASERQIRVLDDRTMASLWIAEARTQEGGEERK